MRKPLLLVALGLSAVGFAAALALGWYSWPLPVLDSQLRSPNSVTFGKQFELTVLTDNPTQYPIVLDSIDIDAEFLEGFEVIQVHPAPTDVMDIPGQRSWAFDRAVGPGRKLAVTFKLEAIRVGDFRGAIDVCNPNQDFTTATPAIQVTRQ